VKYSIITFGCRVNQADSLAIEGELLARDGTCVAPENADLLIVNTCSVTDNADKECRQLVRRIQRKSPESLVVITGCYAQLKPAEIASIPGVDLVLGAAEKFNIAQHLKELTKGDPARICSCDIETVSGFHSSFSIHDRTRTFLKVQDGCDYSCSFCTIPMARGWESKSVESQQESRDARSADTGDRTELETRRKRESIELSRRRVASELAKSRSDVHRAALENALRHLDGELQKLGG